jgi:hypothetical protein
MTSATDTSTIGANSSTYRPGRHDLDAAMNAALAALQRAALPEDTGRFVGLWADAAARVCRVLGFPALLPSEWAEIFTGLATELNMHGFTNLATLERAVAEATQSRASVRLRQRTYDRLDCPRR